jgi:GNAT superfamily N-acetyltransferase
MIDKSLKLYNVILYRENIQNYPLYELPVGYSFSLYQKGDEVLWAALECALGQFETVESGVECFQKEFPEDGILSPEERMLFVKDPNGQIVATCTLWEGDHLGRTLGRFHWLAVSDVCAGKGIAKALFSRLFALALELGYKDVLYLLTGTWYYPAIGMYRKMGFEFYRGERSPFKKLTPEQFREQNEIAIALIEQKLGERGQ